MTMIEELNGTPTLPVVAGAHSAVISGGAIVIPQLLVMATACTPPVESVTLTVKENGPAVVGVPVIAPVVGLRLKPVGNDPEFSAKV